MTYNEPWHWACVADSVKEDELRQMTVSQKEQADQAQKALDDFKLEVENSSAKMYQDMKLQVWCVFVGYFICIGLQLPVVWLYQRATTVTSNHWLASSAAHNMAQPSHFINSH